MKKNFWKKLKRPILALAPMAGITDSAFRQMCRKHGADVVYSEMASVSALFFKPKKTLKLIRFKKNERPYVVQLFGNKLEHFGKATEIINSLPLEKGDQEGFEKFCKINKLSKSPLTPLWKRGSLLRPDGIDINFGCPARKVFSIGSGCALMQEKKKARKIIEEVLKNTNLPVSIKIRAGVRDATAIEFIKHIKDLPFSAVMVHGRTYEGGFHGAVNFEIIEKIKKIIPEKIVLANGGINSPEEAVEILKKYPSLDGLGIARGAWGRPYIFDEIRSALRTSDVQVKRPKDMRCPNKYDFKIIKKIEPHTAKSRSMTQSGIASGSQYNFSKIKSTALKHAQLIYKDKKDSGILEMRKHLAWYVKGFPGASEIRQKLVRVKTLREIKDILSKI